MTATYPTQKLTAQAHISLLVREILTSNIQYLDYQINRITRAFDFSATQNIPSEYKPMPIHEMDRIFCQYEYISRKKWLLIHVRTLLTTTNALLIFNMLSDNCLCDFDKEEMGVILNGLSN